MDPIRDFKGVDRLQMCRRLSNRCSGEVKYFVWESKNIQERIYSAPFCEFHYSIEIILKERLFECPREISFDEFSCLELLDA